MVIKVFLSSPGDVADERGLALRTLGQLNRERYFTEKGVRFEAVAWDGPGVEVPMLATKTAQLSVDQTIGKPSDCNIVVVILWSRIGTPLPDEYRKPDGGPYRSGTEYEFLDAVAAQAKPSKPWLVVYRCRRSVSIDQDAEDADERQRQYKEVRNFFAEFADAQTRAIHRGVNEYKQPADFERLLGAHLRDVAGRILDAEATTTTATHASATPSSGRMVGWQGSPFRGLEVFQEEHEPIFFGRTHEVDGLVARLKDPERRFLAVVGASGSGKSSLVRAGLLPRLRRRAVEGSDGWVYLPPFTPGGLRVQPILNLALGLAPHLAGSEAGKLAGELEANPEIFESLVAKAVKFNPKRSGLFLFVDQLEELFTEVSEPVRERFVRIISAGARTPLVHIAITVRADFYHLCVNDTVLAQLFRERDAVYTLVAPDRSALHEMIVGPARLAGVTPEPGLSERIVSDMCGKSGVPEPGALPLLSFTLDQLYNTRERSHETLRMESYRILGKGTNSGSGIHGAIGKQAEDAFSEVSQDARDAFAEVFRELVHIDENNVPTRRKAPKEKFAKSKGAQELCESFTDLRLLATASGESDEPVIEVAHEAILTNWPRLDDWIKSSRDDLRARRQMSQAASEWHSHGRKEKYLWSDERAVDMAATLERLGLTSEDLSPLEREFLGPIDRETMLQEIDNASTPHERRANIGVRLSLLVDTRPGVGLRPDRLPEIVWCEVPSGNVTLKDNAGTFTVEQIYISKYPITWAQYRAFLEAPDGYKESVWWEGLETQVDKPGKPFNRYDNHPAENVFWLEAVAFCGWLTQKYHAAGLLLKNKVIRLPTEWEWQQAATGGDESKEYPWGAWNSDCANTYESGLNRSTAVGMYPHGASPQPIGALDMSGNVWEWCLNKYESPKDINAGGRDYRVLRGGSWGYDKTYASACNRLGFHLFDHLVGFRVVSSSPIS